MASRLAAEPNPASLRTPAHPGRTRALIAAGLSLVALGCHGSNDTAGAHDQAGTAPTQGAAAPAAGGTAAGTAADTGAASGVGGSTTAAAAVGGAGITGGALAAGRSGSGAAAGSSGAAATENTPTMTEASPCVANPFALANVTLLPSDFTQNRDRTLGYLRAIDIESLLYNFRTTAGLSTNNARPPTGWEAPDSNLRGHATGHVLKALAQAYAGTQDPQFKRKADTLVAELKKCQDMAEAKGFGAGYLGAYPPDQFIELESLAQYPTIWAPYYTMHKLLAGLLASYELTDNAMALDMAKKLALWAHERLSKLPRTQLQKMWNLYIAGETGGMNEVLAELYEVTGEQVYLETAVLFDKDVVLDGAAADQDILAGLHANQHIPTITGYLRIYEGNHEAKYLDAAKNFWSIVTTDHMYAIGGTGEAEMFRPAKQIAAQLTDKTAESCATYNMLKLTGRLFCHDPDVKYMDYYERGLYNHILGSQDPTSNDRAAVTYFVPLSPGARRTYNNTFTCCHGTGMENHTKYQAQIYAYSSDRSTLYVNLYIPSTLHWADRGLTLEQSTHYPYEPSTQLTITGEGPLKIALRVPGWATQGFQISVNGAAQNVATTPGTYAIVDRTWSNGDRIDVQMTFDFRVEKTPDDSSIGAILYGPDVLVATSNKTSTMTLNVDPNDPAASFTPNGEPLGFTADGLTFEPFSKATNIQYHTYFKF